MRERMLSFFIQKMEFTLKHKDKDTGARCGVMQALNGEKETTVLRPVAPRATVRTFRAGGLSEGGVERIRSTAYKLYMRRERI